MLLPILTTRSYRCFDPSGQPLFEQDWQIFGQGIRRKELRRDYLASVRLRWIKGSPRYDVDRVARTFQVLFHAGKQDGQFEAATHFFEQLPRCRYQRILARSHAAAWRHPLG